MKTGQKVLIGVVVAIIAIVSIVFWATSGITGTADDFFDAVEAGDMDAAYALTSKQLQAETSQQDLERYLKGSGLGDVNDTSWSSRSIEGSIGKLDGTATTAAGGTIPLHMELVKEGGAWRILLIRHTAGGIEDSGGAVTLPPLPQEQQKMVLADTRQLVEAIIDDDPQHFLERWVDQATVNDLGNGFATLKPFVPQMVATAQDAPEITAVAMGKDGVLLLEGTYRAQGVRAVSMFKYMKVGDEWKIVAYDYAVEPDPEAKDNGSE